MMLIRLYPFVYMDVINEGVIFYDTLYSSAYMIKVEGHIVVYNKTTFKIDENVNNELIAGEICKKKIGIVNILRENTNDVYIDFSTAIASFFNDYFLTPNNFKAITAIKRLFVSLVKTVDMLSFKKTACEGFMDKETLLSLRKNIYKLTSLKSIGFVVNKSVFDDFSILYEQFHTLYDIAIYLSSEDYLCLKKKLQKMGDVKIHILYSSKNEMHKLLKDDKVYSVYLDATEVVSSEKLQKEMIFNPRVRMFFFNGNNNLTVGKMLSYDVKDLLKSRTTLNDIVRNEWMNYNFWGDLYINADGELLLDEHQAIGNVNAWKNISFSNLLSEKSLWRNVRRFDIKCRKCLYRNLCPPLSLVELIYNMRFCNIYSHAIN